MAIPTVEHSTLSFSGRERWANCPGSVILAQGMPDSSGAAASEGTCAHTVAEFYVRQAFDLPGAQPGDPVNVDPPPGLARFEGKTGLAYENERAEWNEEMRKHGKGYVAYIRSLIPLGAKAFVDVEQRVSAASIDKRLFGTLDLRIWFPDFRVLLVLDYKYGFQEVDVGIETDPNKQLGAYGVASLDTFNGAIEGVMLAIYQPRRPLGDAGHKLYLPATWVAKERAVMAQEVVRVDQAAAVFTTGDITAFEQHLEPGEHCRYCKAAPKCPKTQAALQAALDTSAGLRSVLDMPEDDLLALYASRSAVKALMEDIAQRVEQLAKTGSTKIAIETKAGRRMWRNTSEVTLTLLALGLDKCLTPGPLSEVIDQIPEQFREALVGRARDSVSIKVLRKNEPRAVAQMFKKYTKGVDAPATNP